MDARMNIDINLLKSYGAVPKSFQKGEFIFKEGDPARFYHQITSGRVKMSCFNDDGKIFTFLIFREGESFGEPSVLIQEHYPAFAIADGPCTVMMLVKDSFIQLLDDHPEYQKKFLYLFAQRLYNKTNTSKLIISESPEQRILSFLKKYKREHQAADDPILVHYTRQEIADFTGLRVETIIRTIRKMHKSGKLTIKDRKVYL